MIITKTVSIADLGRHLSEEDRARLESYIQQQLTLRAGAALDQMYCNPPQKAKNDDRQIIAPSS